MAIIDRLNTEWISGEESRGVFEFRAIAQDCYQTMIITVAKFDALIASTKFTSVDAEIKTVGASVRKIINDAKVLLDGKSEFLKWTQPKS
jgi:hypothetical protein